MAVRSGTLREKALHVRLVSMTTISSQWPLYDPALLLFTVCFLFEMGFFSLWASKRWMLALTLRTGDEPNNNGGPAITAPAIRRGARRMWVHDTIPRRQKYNPILAYTIGLSCLCVIIFNRRIIQLRVDADGQNQLLLHLLGCQGDKSQPIYYMIGWLERAPVMSTALFCKSWEIFN